MIDEFIYHIAQQSVIGTREEQQDYVRLAKNQEELLAVVCDGMGGMHGGAQASESAAECLVGLFEKKCANESIPAFFMNCVDIMDESVFRLFSDKKEKALSGTTVVAALINNGKLFWLSVGDSRLYIIRNGTIEVATRDHNYSFYIKEMSRLGTVTAEELEIGKEKGDALISYIGMGGVELMDISQNPFVLEDNDYVLLATDGLFKNLTAEQIKDEIEHSSDVEVAATSLIERAEEYSNGQSDNVSFVLIKVEGKSDETV